MEIKFISSHDHDKINVEFGINPEYDIKFYSEPDNKPNNEDIYKFSFKTIKPINNVNVVKEIEDIRIGEDERIDSKLLEAIILPSMFNDIFDTAEMGVNAINNYILEMYKSCFKKTLDQKEIDIINKLRDEDILKIKIVRAYDIKNIKSVVSPERIENSMRIHIGFSLAKDEYAISHSLISPIVIRQINEGAGFYGDPEYAETAEELLKKAFQKTMSSMGIETNYTAIHTQLESVTTSTLWSTLTSRSSVPISFKEKDFLMKLKSYNNLLLKNIIESLLK